MTMSVKAEPQKTSTGTPEECAGCGKKIQDRYLLKALDMFWHEDCLKCGCCDCRLGEVGSTLYTKGNLILCKRDYLRLFGTTGYCAACNKVIPAFEMVMRARTNVYHLECFACQQCNHRFCVGDRFFLCDNKILCEYDYEERMVFANLAYNSSNLAQIKQTARSMTSSPNANGAVGSSSNGGHSVGSISNNNNSIQHQSHLGGLPSHSKSTMSSSSSSCISSSMSSSSIVASTSSPDLQGLHPSGHSTQLQLPVSSASGGMHHGLSPSSLMARLPPPTSGPSASLLPLPPPMSSASSGPSNLQSPMVT